MSNHIRPYLSYTPDIDGTAYVDPSAVVIGRCTIGKDSSIWPTAVLRADINTITVGERTNIQDGTIVHVTHDGPYTPGGTPMRIGSQVTIGHQVMLHACHIDDLCLIGMGAVLLDGCHIPSHTIIGAGTLVLQNKVLESGYLYLGTPAKRGRKLTTKEIDFLAYSADHYVTVKNNYQQTT